MSVPAYVRWMPRRTVSRVLGWLARRRVPRWLLRRVLRAYCRGFGVDMGEAALPLEAYATFDAFFTRPLKDGLRPLDPDPAAVVAPVDARVYMAGPIEAGTVLQAKGVPYTVADLLGDAADAAPFDGGTFVTAYLSPKDYHRIHWPWDGEVDHVRHLPGDLWPVNDRALAGVPGLFARNERVAIVGRVRSGAAFAMVPVGALNVGSIGLEFHDVRTNRGRVRAPRTVPLTPPVVAVRGARAAWFSFGSAVVLLLAPGGGRLDAVAPGTILRLGRRIGSLTR